MAALKDKLLIPRNAGQENEACHARIHDGLILLIVHHSLFRVRVEDANAKTTTQVTHTV